MKAKGTLPALRTLITSYGIPDTVLRINEFGGKDKSNTNDWDYWENTFNYSFYTTGSNYIASTWAPINGSWLTQDGVPESISFRFKTNGLPFDTASIDYQTLWQVDNNRVYLTLRYDGTGYVSGSYSGSIPNPYNQYAYLELYPDYISNPTVSASIYLPFFDGGWWSVMVNKSPEIAGNSTYTLYAGDKIYDGGNNGTALGFYATSSVFVDTVPWTSYGTSYFALGPNTINGNTYKAFSGSLQEIRYYTSPLSESAFKDYIMNPYSIEGNYLNSSPNELLFRASLGGELYTGSVSIHPKVTGSWITTSSFVGNSDFAFFTTPTFIPNTEYFFYDQVAAGIQNAVSDKIRIEDGIYPSGNTLSPFRSLAQNLAISQSYTVNTNLLEVAFSPQDEINQDISDQIGYFNIGEFIGDPRFRSSSLTSYPDLDALRDAYFEKYTKNYDLNDYIRLIKFFDNSLFKMIKDFVPAKANLSTGIIVKPHILERSKYKRNKPTSFYSENTSSIEMLYVDGTNPQGIELNTDYSDYVTSSLGYITKNNNDKSQPFTGEFGGSEIFVSNGEFLDYETSNIITQDSAGYVTYSLEPLLNNVSSSRKSNILLDVDYSSNPNIPVNNGLISGAFDLYEDRENNPNGGILDSKYWPFAEVEDYGYNIFSYSNPRYDGSKTYSQNYNQYSDGDSSYGKTAAVDHYVKKIGLFTEIESSSFFLNRNSVTLTHLVDENGGYTKLDGNNTNWEELQMSLADLKMVDKEMEKQIEKLFEDEQWLVLKPLSYLASKKYGASTKWCTQYFKFIKKHKSN